MRLPHAALVVCWLGIGVAARAVAPVPTDADRGARHDRLSASTYLQTDGLTATGLFPVYDSSGETHGDDLASYLTPAIYQAFKEGGRELVLLNPGGSYNLLDESASLDFARAAGVQVILLPRFAPTQRTSQTDKAPRLQVEVRAVDVTKGTLLHAFTVTEEVSRKDLDKGFDKGPGLHRFWVVLNKYSDKSRRVEKQALGKTVRNLADAIRLNVLGFTGGALVYPSAALHPGPFPASCEIDFSIKYMRQRSASKAYALLVNDRDESAGINNDGVTPLTLKSGLNLFEVTVKDAPYRLPVQKVYTINRWMDCAPAERHLAMEIAAAGEALIVARP